MQPSFWCPAKPSPFSDLGHKESAFFNLGDCETVSDELVGKEAIRWVQFEIKKCRILLRRLSSSVSCDSTLSSYWKHNTKLVTGPSWKKLSAIPSNKFSIYLVVAVRYPHKLNPCLLVVQALCWPYWWWLFKLFDPLIPCTKLPSLPLFVASFKFFFQVNLNKCSTSCVGRSKSLTVRTTYWSKNKIMLRDVRLGVCCVTYKWSVYPFQSVCSRMLVYFYKECCLKRWKYRLLWFHRFSRVVSSNPELCRAESTASRRFSDLTEFAPRSRRPRPLWKISVWIFTKDKSRPCWDTTEPGKPRCAIFWPVPVFDCMWLTSYNDSWVLHKCLCCFFVFIVSVGWDIGTSVFTAFLAQFPTISVLILHVSVFMRWSPVQQHTE